VGKRQIAKLVQDHEIQPGECSRRSCRRSVIAGAKVDMVVKLG